MIVFPPTPIPVIVEEKGKGYILYIKDNGMFDNDEFTIVLSSTGEILHITTKQFTLDTNFTYGIKI